MIFAQVMKGVIVNVIVLSSPGEAPKFKHNPVLNKDFDCVIRIDNIKVNHQTPGINWKSNCKNKFVPPPG